MQEPTRDKSFIAANPIVGFRLDLVSWSTPSNPDRYQRPPSFVGHVIRRSRWAGASANVEYVGERRLLEAYEVDLWLAERADEQRAAEKAVTEGGAALVRMVDAPPPWAAADIDVQAKPGEPELEATFAGVAVDMGGGTGVDLTGVREDGESPTLPPPAPVTDDDVRANFVTDSKMANTAADRVLAGNG